MTGSAALQSGWGLVLEAGVSGPLRGSPGRSSLAVIAIALGVAMGMAIHLINRSAADEVSLAARSLFGLADLTVHGAAAGFDENLYPQIARLPGVRVASPVVEVEARLADARGSLTVLGIDPLRAYRLLPALASQVRTRGTVHEGERSLYLSPAAARGLRLAPGNTLDLQVGLTRERFHVAGLLPAMAYRQAVAVGDIAQVQWRLGQLGHITRIDVRLASGANAAMTRAAIAKLLPSGVEVTTPGARADEALRLTRAYRANLTALALVALFTGAFLVYATQSLAIVRRRRELAVMHALGLTAREQVLLTLAGGAVLGVLGAGLGVLLGALVADVGLEIMGADLGAGYFDAHAIALDVQPLEWLAFFLLGLAVALIGSVRPAIAAARVPAAAALKSGDMLLDGRPRPRWPGVALLVLAALILLLPPVGGLPLPGYAAIALALIGAVALMPALTHAIFARLPLTGSPSLAVACAHLRATAPQATVSIAAILVSFSLMVAMAVMVTSFRDSLAAWLDKILPADLYLRAGQAGDSAYVPPVTLAALADVPGVRTDRRQPLHRSARDASASRR